MRRFALLPALLCLTSLFMTACREALVIPDNLPEGEFVMQWEDVLPRAQLGQEIPLRLWLRTSPEIESSEPDVPSSMDTTWGGKPTATEPGRWIDKDGYRYFTRAYKLVWFRLDERALPAVEHSGKKGEETVIARTEILDFDVRGSLGASAAGDAEVPAGLIVDAPGKPIWPWLLGLAALVLVLGTGLLFLQKSKSAMHPIGVPAALPADQEALRRIKELARELEAGRIGGEEIVVQVSDILRRWLQAGLMLSSLARTSEEFLASMREGQDLPPPLLQPLYVFLEQCDLVKFAAQSADHELCSRLLAIAKDFVMKSSTSGGFACKLVGTDG